MYLVGSALQKAIRRGDREVAMFSALELVRSGYFFCARIGDEVFMRYVPREWETIETDDDDDDVLIQDTLTCLKRIECPAETERVLPDEMRERIYDAWEVAREDIFWQWQEQTDPLNVQPDIRSCSVRSASISGTTGQTT